ncbi:hypothetical protein F0562_033510 [Nyssa sinensis]|uniref:Rubisco LSMT substrate-binding domain-containing protein n=1 Tax=Nyssa sinensis TaxID=561372 RepID=A0A5J5AGM0_9ASTE|nr:hypothetical protein F0562_033510 [Nyssa sinensis]
MKLGLKLLQERAKIGSFWWPYISNLPETYSVPIFFPGEDIKNLQYAPLLYQVNKRCKFLLDFEKEVKHALESLKPDDHPFRSFSPNAEIVQEQEAGKAKMLVKVVAGTQIKRNDPLVLNYGCLNNDLFLLDYGFVIPSNPYDCIELKYDAALLDAASMAGRIAAPNFSSPAPWQQQILYQLNLDGEDPVLKKVSLGGPELVEGRLLAALRILLASDMETVQKHDLGTLKSLSVEAPLGVTNEVAALRTVIALCMIALGHFPTKIMEDESLLKQGVSGSTELAIQFRIQKKSLIIDVMRDLTRRVNLLLSKESITAQGATPVNMTISVTITRSTPSLESFTVIFSHFQHRNQYYGRSRTHGPARFGSYRVPSFQRHQRDELPNFSFRSRDN